MQYKDKNHVDEILRQLELECEKNAQLSVQLQQHISHVSVFHPIFNTQQHICRAVLYDIARLSLCPSVTWMDQSKNGWCLDYAISLYSSPIPVVFVGQLLSRNSDGFPRAGASNKGGVRWWSLPSSSRGKLLRSWQDMVWENLKESCWNLFSESACPTQRHRGGGPLCTCGANTLARYLPEEMVRGFSSLSACPRGSAVIIIRIRCRSSVTITCGYSESYCKLHQILRLISAINISGDVLRFLSLLYCDIFVISVKSW